MNIKNKTYQYDAFISYSRKDEKFAKKLEAQLERHSIPKELRSNRKKLNVFRDVQDLVGNDLTNEIKRAIQNSECLIVICSPNARRSQWVGKEIEEFSKFHGTDKNGKYKIFPVLLWGRPNTEVTSNDLQRFSLG